MLLLFIFISEFNYIVNVFILFSIRGQQQLTDMLYSFHCYTYVFKCMITFD